MCVDNPNDADGTHALQLWRCHGYASNGGAQRWEFIRDGISPTFNRVVYRIVNVDSGLCIGTATGTSRIMQESCFTDTRNGRIDWILDPVDPSNPASDFQIEYAGDFFYPGGFCMAANTFIDANGNALILAPCDYYNTSQYFNLG